MEKVKILGIGCMLMIIVVLYIKFYVMVLLVKHIISGGNNEIKNIDVVTKICIILDKLKPMSNGKKYSEMIKYVKDRPGHDFRYAIDSGKINTQLNWYPS